MGSTAGVEKGVVVAAKGVVENKGHGKNAEMSGVEVS